MTQIKYIKHFFKIIRKKDHPVYASANALLYFSIFSLFFLTLNLLIHNLIILSLTFITFINIFCSYFFYKAFSNNIREPDYVFNYGYGKYESLSIFLSAIFYLIALIYLIFFGIRNIRIGSASIEIDIFANILLLIYTIVIYYVYKTQKSNYQRIRYQNLQINYKYYKKLTLVSISYFVLFSSSKILEYYEMNIVANVIESTTAIVGVTILLIKPLTEFKNAFDQLVDKNLPEHIQFDLIGVVAENLHRMCRFNTMHTRQSGNEKFIELDIVLPYNYSIDDKYKLENDLKEAILKKHPDSIFRLYVVPCDKDCEFKDGNKCPIKRNN